MKTLEQIDAEILSDMGEGMNKYADALKDWDSGEGISRKTQETIREALVIAERVEAEKAELVEVLEYLLDNSLPLMDDRLRVKDALQKHRCDNV